MRNPMTWFPNGWDGVSSATRHPYTHNKSKENKTSSSITYQGNSITQINPSQRPSNSFYYHGKRHNYKSNHCSKILSREYCPLYLHQPNKRNLKIHGNKEIWQLGKVVKIPHTRRSGGKILVGKTTWIQGKTVGIIFRICMNKPVWDHQ